MALNYDPERLSELLASYYKQLFPFKPFVQWLSYGKKPSTCFGLREFAFILKDDVHLRYRSFADQSELEKEMRKECPHKLDIGAIYNHRPREHKKFRDFEAKERELIFDIDLSDYDDVRTCCKGGAVCKKCWRFMILAVNVLDKILQCHFGFNHRMWLFSGRRGVHCWVADNEARKLLVSGRNAVAEYLTVQSGGGEQGPKRVNIQASSKARQPHPLFTEAYQLIMNNENHMEKLVVEQGWLDNADRWAEVLKLCANPDVRATLEANMRELTTPQDRWRSLLLHFYEPERQKLREKMPDEKLPEISDKGSKWFLMEFVLQYVYPRLDTHVTTGLNHLLKSPFAIHPKTGKVAVPFNADLVHKFDPDSVPRIDRLIAEVSAMEKQENAGSENRKALDYKRTSLAPFVETFEKFVRDLLADEKAVDSPVVNGAVEMAF